VRANLKVGEITAARRDAVVNRQQRLAIIVGSRRFDVSKEPRVERGDAVSEHAAIVSLSTSAGKVATSAGKVAAAPG